MDRFGGQHVVQAIEVIIAEVRFYDIDRSAHPLFLEVLNFLKRATSSC